MSASQRAREPRHRMRLATAGAVAAFPIMHRMHSISELIFRMAADDVSPLNQAGLQMRTHDRPFRNGEVSIFGRPGTSGFERESDYQKR